MADLNRLGVDLKCYLLGGLVGKKGFQRTNSQQGLGFKDLRKNPLHLLISTRPQWIHLMPRGLGAFNLEGRGDECVLWAFWIPHERFLRMN